MRQPFEVLRPMLTQATARVQKVQTGKGKGKQQALLEGKLCSSMSFYLHLLTILGGVQLGVQATYCKHSLRRFQKKQMNSEACGRRLAGDVGQLSANTWRFTPQHSFALQHLGKHSMPVPGAGCPGGNQSINISGFAAFCSNSTSNSRHQQHFCSEKTYHSSCIDICWRCQFGRPCTNFPNTCSPAEAAGMHPGSWSCHPAV